MDQLFRDHLPYMVGGVLAGVIVALLPRQTKWARRLSRTVLAIGLGYPAVILLLFAARARLGESYAYLIYGDILGILLGIVAGVIGLAWLAVYVRGIIRPKEPEGT